MHRLRLTGRGEITVFLSLILMLIISLALGVIDVVRIYGTKDHMARATNLALEAFLTDYSIPLKERYGLFAVDGGYGQAALNEMQIEAMVDTYTHYNAGDHDHASGNISWFKADINQISIDSLTKLSDYDFQILEHEMIEYMKFYWGIDTLKDILSKDVKEEAVSGTQDKKDDYLGELNEENELAKKAAKEAAAEEDSQSTDGADKDKNEDINIKDPRKTITLLIETGILALVVDNSTEISNAELSQEEVSFPVKEETLWERLTNFEDSDNFTKQLEQFDLSENMLNLVDESAKTLLVNEYILDRFKYGPYESRIKESTALQYEVEYIICGQSQDSKNLESVANRIIFIRSLFNTSYLLSDQTKSSAVHTLASGIASAMLVPYLEKVIHLLIIYAWAYAEAIIDCRALLQGKRVPMIKNSQNWNLSLKNLGNLAADQLGDYANKSGEETETKGITYADYLRFFMLTTDREKKLSRVLNLIESNIRQIEGYSNFNISNCIFGLSCQIDYTISSIFTSNHTRAYKFISKEAICY